MALRAVLLAAITICSSSVVGQNAAEIFDQLQRSVDSVALKAAAAKLEATSPAYSKLLMARVASSGFAHKKAIDRANEARRQFVQLGDEQGVLKCLNLLAVENMLLKENDTCLKNARQCVALARQLEKPFEEGDCLCSMGGGYRQMQEFDSAKLVLRRARSHFERNNLMCESATAIQNMGTVYHSQSLFDSALSYTYLAIEILESCKSSDRRLGTAYAAVGNLAVQLRDFQLGLRYHKLSAEFRRKTGDTKGLSDNFTNLGNLYLDQKQNDSALWAFDSALALAQRIHNKQRILWSYNNIGNARYYMNDFSGAQHYFEQALTTALEINDQVEIARLHANIGYSLLKLGRNDEAKASFDRGMQHAETIDVLEVKMVALSGLADYFEATGDYKQALQYFVKSREVQDQMLNERRTAQFAEMETRYETGKKEKALALAAKREAENQLEINKQRFTIAGLLAAIIAAGLLILGWRYRTKKRQEAHLREKELAYKKQLLDTTVIAQEEERQRIAKDLHDGLVQSLAAVKMGLQKIESSHQLPPEVAAQLHSKTTLVDEAANEARTISHQMMPRVLTESGLVAAMDDMLHKTLAHTDIQFRFDHFGLGAERFKPTVEIGLYRICQEMVNNVIKHSGATELSVQLLKSANHLVMHVEDNGRGFDASKVGGGIGMSNIFSRASAVNGEVHFEPGSSRGTSAHVRVPLGF